ncbi:hypothetical protein [Glycomyces arizonensis]|uniref:hypothetical protein n=1 Tax=Glycomyces arizonensis TaxID=256035 RepID=UPI000427C404|nr:hypothetical protein [Glycomyces arizonensis]
MRRTLRLLLLIGIGLVLAKPHGPDGPDGPTNRSGNGNGADPPPHESPSGKINTSQGTKSASDAVEAEAGLGRSRQSGSNSPGGSDTGGQKPVQGPAANTDPRAPSSRHNLNQIRRKSPAKDENTVVLPGTDVNGDIEAIKSGDATWNPETQRYELDSGRSYGMELPKGTLFPDSGPGFVKLDRPQYQILKEMMNANGDLDAAQGRIEQNPYLNSESDWNAALEVFKNSNRYQGDPQ